MSVALVTGSAGLIGSETVRFFAERGLDVVGIDNDMRSVFFGDDASTRATLKNLEESVAGYRHVDADIRDEDAMNRVFREFERDIAVIVHAAGQPSHDWAASDPMVDYSINATGTLILLEAARKYCPEAPFLFLSTNKVYGDTPNRLPLIEQETRWELEPSHPFAKQGIDESMSIDASTHSLFGVSKAAADLMVQEYGHYFGMKTACFRGSCLTGPAHAGAELHGFLAYLMKCAVQGRSYKVFGYKGKQVRDNIHSFDLVNALWHFFEAPRTAEIYNMGGSRHSHCSMQEALHLCEELAGRELDHAYEDSNRTGDHIWWISDVGKFQEHYPGWRYRYDLRTILEEIRDAVME
jgi:CDP-paratose 2-epimerase